LPRQGPPAGEPGNLVLVALPWAEVFIDGERAGLAPGFRGKGLPPGRHRLTLVHPQFGKVERDILIKPGVTTNVEIDLEHAEH
jgi:serine/threonine-protein kinase